MGKQSSKRTIDEVTSDVDKFPTSKHLKNTTITIDNIEKWVIIETIDVKLDCIKF